MSARSPRWARGSGARHDSVNPQLRVSDAERANVADRLSRHYGDGRLDRGEFNERLDQAMKAKTQSDLTGLFTDLPDIEEPQDAIRPQNAPPPTASHRPRHRVIGRALIIVIAAIIARQLSKGGPGELFQLAIGNNWISGLVGLAILAFVWPILLPIIFRDRKARQLGANSGKTSAPYSRAAMIYSLAMLAVVAVLAYAYQAPPQAKTFPADYSFKYGKERPFAPSLATTATDGFMDEQVLSGSRSCGITGVNAPGSRKRSKPSGPASPKSTDGISAGASARRGRSQNASLAPASSSPATSSSAAEVSASRSSSTKLGAADA